ncbi:MAG: hypothetical protein IJ013_06630 [Bacteroidaceae bacterium]|nr:hypothetical protein [Bacteroidaceae bacterium]
MKQPHNDNITPLRKYIAIGYAIIALLIGGIVFIYLHEWRELERIEAESKEISLLNLCRGAKEEDKVNALKLKARR